MENEQKVSVIELRYNTNIPDSCPLLYEIEVNDDTLGNIKKGSAILIYEQLGKFLFPEKA